MKILLIEPDNANAGSLLKIIKEYIRTVDKVSDNREAVSFARTGNYDLMVVNPVYDSEEYITLLTKLRKRSIRTPILFVSASSTVEARVLALNNGADDALSRPFDIEEFYARLRALGRRYGTYYGDNISLGDMTFNRREHFLEKGGERLHLGGKEFSVMELLALNQRQVVPKEKFDEKVWGYDSDAEYNTVEVYISFLRKKFRQLGSKLRIAAVRGVGYRLVWEDLESSDEWYFL